jgi:hypothetical protein
MKAIPCEKLPRTWRSHTTLCTTPFTEQLKLSLIRIGRGLGGPGAQLSKRTSTLECLVWETDTSQVLNWQYPQNTHLNINSEEVTLECWPSRQSSSLQYLCYFARLNLFFLLASLRYGFFFGTLPRSPASRSHLFTVNVETCVFTGCPLVSKTMIDKHVKLLEFNHYWAQIHIHIHRFVNSHPQHPQFVKAK